MLSYLTDGHPSARRPFAGQTSVNEDFISIPSTAELEATSLVSKQLRFTNGRVVVSPRQPSQPPKSFGNTGDSFPFGTPPNSTDRISKRSVRLPNHPAGFNSPDPSMVPACESVSRWVRLTDAEDLWGSRVTVLQQFDNGRGERVDQYFYETYCSRTSAVNPPPCTGTDRVNFDSYCLERHVWAYGKVYDQQRQERWTFIKIRASCNCGLSRKGLRRTRSASPNVFLFSK